MLPEREWAKTSNMYLEASATYRMKKKNSKNYIMLSNREQAVTKLTAE